MAKTILGLATADNERPLSKGRKSFHALIDKIEKRRAALAEWEAFGVDFQRRYNDEFMPLRARFDAVRTELVHCLDQAYGKKGLTKGERQTIADLIAHFAGNLLQSVDDPVVAEIHRRYSAPADIDEAAMGQALREMLEAKFGVEIPDDVDFGSPEDVIRHVNEQIEQQEELERKHREAREEYHAKRKASPKREATEERARTEQAEIHLSLREVYRKLASVLHPDREIDPVERERKAALMQRVNVAYGNRSLLDLLEIQLELEQIDQAALDNISEDRLKRWNAILKDQLHDLDMELAEVGSGFMVRCGMNPMQRASTRAVKRALSMNIADLREYTKAFEQNLRVFDDPARLKTWLRQMKWELAG